MVVLCLNERENLERLGRQLGSALPVVCVDSGSTDGSQDVVRRLPGWTLLEHEWVSSGTQLNWAFDHIPGADWHLVLDADEELEFPADEVLRLAEGAAGRGKRAVAFDRHNYLGDRRLRFGGWSPDWQARLLASDVRYGEDAVHAHPLLEEDEILFSKGRTLRHYSYRDIDHYIDKLGYYLAVEARLPRNLDSHRPRHRKLRNFAQRIPAPGLARFVYLYFIRLGFLEGRLGFYLALWTGFKFSVGRGRYVLTRSGRTRRGRERPSARS